MSPEEYNKSQLEIGLLKYEDLTELTRFWQEHHNLVVDGKLGPRTIGSILDATTKRNPPPKPPAGPPTSLVDLRSKARPKYPTRERNWSQVTGVCLHQTACVLGERPERWESVGCHVGITRTGKAIWLHDFDKRVVHGNGWNAQTVGIEIDGLYEGVLGNPKTLWDNPETPEHEIANTLTLAAIETTRQVIRWIHAEVTKHGGELKVLVAHRQASMNRRNDPGSAIWKAIALPMHEELTLTDGGIGFIVGGYPIPESWDERCKGVPY